MTMIITGVARTGGNVESLKRLARCSGKTRRLKEPVAPTGMGCMTFASPWREVFIAQGEGPGNSTDISSACMVA
jgi:hypothetical protein